MKHNLGIMQGRLTPSLGRGIQFFPFDNWKNEFIKGSEIGLNEIEFIFDYERYEENPLWTDKGCKEIKDIIDETGVVINSICFDYFMRRPFYKYKKDERDYIEKENTEFINRILIAMRKLNISLIEIPSVDNSSLQSDDEKLRYSKWLKKIAKDNIDIKFGMETDLPPEEFRDFIDDIGMTNVGANYDSGNSSGIGYDLYEEVTTLRDRIFNLHIKDRKYQGSTVKLGTGSANFDDLFRGLKEIGYAHAFILQAARGIDGEEKSNISSQLNFINKYIEKYGV